MRAYTLLRKGFSPFYFRVIKKNFQKRSFEANITMTLGEHPLPRPPVYVDSYQKILGVIQKWEILIKSCG